jgi:endonuclease/exonuclease/phosphatase family metal-dependent hydrolase
VSADEARPFRVITYNTAVGNRRIKTPQTAFLALPFYRDVIEGSNHAPILALQEVGPKQARALKEAARGGAFRMIHIQRPGQGNAIVVPRRFEVLSRTSRFYGRPALRAIGRSLARWVGERRSPNWGQLLEPRMWSRVRLRDRESGRELTFFNTHLALDPILRLEQARSLHRRVRRAQQTGPVIVAGDFNTRTAETATPEQDRWDAPIRALFEDLTDMGLSSPDRRKSSIDYILASGFEALSSRVWTGDSLQLPGFPRAELISDHYPEEDLLRFS